MERRNIFWEVWDFQAEDSATQNFIEVMEWLLDLVDANEHLPYLSSEFTIAYGKAAVKIKVKTEPLSCHVYEWHREKQEWKCHVYAGCE